MLLRLLSAATAGAAPRPSAAAAQRTPPPKRPEGGGVLVDEALGEALTDLRPPRPPRLPPTAAAAAETRLQRKKEVSGAETKKGGWLPQSAINPFLILHPGRRQGPSTK